LKNEMTYRQTVRKDNTSGVVGVCWYPRRAHWIAFIKVNGRQLHLGSFDTRKKAEAARKNAEIKYGKKS